MSRLEGRLEQQDTTLQHQQCKVHEVLGQMAVLIDATTQAHRKGKEHDGNIESIRLDLQRCRADVQKAPKLAPNPEADRVTGNDRDLGTKIQNIEELLFELEGQVSQCKKDVQQMQRKTEQSLHNIAYATTAGSIFCLKAISLDNIERDKLLDDLHKKEAELKVAVSAETQAAKSDVTIPERKFDEYDPLVAGNLKLGPPREELGKSKSWINLPTSKR